MRCRQCEATHGKNRAWAAGANASSRGGISITAIEYNRVLNATRDKYEAVLVYLIRRGGVLRIYSDGHVIGLFAGATWSQLLKDAGFGVTRRKLRGLYDPFVLNDGEYDQTMFVCRRGV